MKKRNGIIKICPVCGIEFYVPAYRAKTARYCSTDCQNHGQYKSLTKICEGCGKEFKVSNSRMRQKFCSEACEHLVTIDNKERRRRQKIICANSRGYRSQYLRQKTIELHNHKCDYCGYSGYDCCLDIHHIDENPNNDADDNRAVLCAICHRLYHKGVFTYAIETRKFAKSNK